MLEWNRYEGSHQTPFPPMGSSWSIVGGDNQIACARAAELLGMQVPPWSYRDELLSNGFYRFFAVETGDGRIAMCALRMVRRRLGMGTLGDAAAGGDPGGSSGDTGNADTGGTSTDTGAATTDTTQGATSGDVTQTDANPGGGGGGGQPVKPAPQQASTLGSSSTGLVVGVVAALAVAATVVAAAAAKHPVKHSHSHA